MGENRNLEGQHYPSTPWALAHVSPCIVLLASSPRYFYFYSVLDGVWRAFYLLTHLVLRQLSVAYHLFFFFLFKYVLKRRGSLGYKALGGEQMITKSVIWRLYYAWFSMPALLHCSQYWLLQAGLFNQFFFFFGD
jgi:hypothetical protein